MLRIQFPLMLIPLAAVALLTIGSCKPAERPAPPPAKSTAENVVAPPEPTTNSAEPNTVGMPESRSPSKTTVETPSTVTSNEQPEEPVAMEVEQPRRPIFPKLPPPADAQRLAPDYDVWLDLKKGIVIVDGLICLREGMLEMFACTRNTKEHEAIVSANTRAFLVHAALLRLGAEPGKPVQHMPQYQPPSGPEIEITVEWRDEKGKEISMRAQEMIKDLKTGKTMTYPFVFAGSLFLHDEDGKEYYLAEQGEFICVSNFSSAMLDIPVESSDSNAELEFVAFTERVPQLGTPVRLTLKPKLKKDEKAARGAERPKEDRETPSR